MEAAEAGVTFQRVEVVVESDSDDYGILGIDDSIPAGPLRSLARVRLEADVHTADVDELVKKADQRCPVTDAVRRAVPWTVQVI
jgi:organic hydroperoxide reductase OsmC/OhrA